MVFSTPGVNTHNPPASSTILFLGLRPSTTLSFSLYWRTWLERKRWEVGRSQGVYWVGEQLATTWNKGRGCPVQLLFPKLTLKQPFIFAASSASGPERPLAIFLSLLGGSAATTVMCFNSPIAHWRFSLPRNALPVATLHGSPAFKALLLDSCPHPVAFVSWPFFLHFFLIAPF